MLQIKLDINNQLGQLDCIADVEELFKKIKITGKPEERRAIELLEQGRYLDENGFIDRFGYKLRLSELSTGCKAILCVLNTPDQWIDTKECGLNAISVMISLCRDGKIIIHDLDSKLKTYGLNKEICVAIDGRVFTDYDSFNEYIDSI